MDDEVTHFDIETHGVHNSSFWQGCPTRLDERVNGIGETQKQAVEDAVDTACSMFDLEEFLPFDLSEYDDDYTIDDFIEDEGLNEGEEEDRPYGGPQLHFYATIHMETQ